jgi:hypothetical protein
MKLISSLSVLVLVLTASKKIRADDEEGYCSRDEVDCSDENIEEEADMVFIKGGTFTMGTDLPIFVADGKASVDVSKLSLLAKFSATPRCAFSWKISKKIQKKISENSP